MSEVALLFVGVDGGGTATRVLVTDARGRERARRAGPASLIEAARPGATAEIVARLVRSALEGARREEPGAEARALFAGLAGAGYEPARAAVEEALARAGIARRIRVGTDVEAAFHDAFGDGPGLLLLAGTGSVGRGRSGDGRQGRVGGWGSLLGDEGSGWAIGVDCLRCVVRAEDGRGPRTELSRAVMARLALEGPEELVVWAGGASKADVAALVPVVQAEARAGDTVAADILRRAAEALEGQIEALLERLGPWRAVPRVALGGGLLEEGGALRTALIASLGSRGLEVVEGHPVAVRGAAGLARALGAEGGATS